MLPNAPRFKAKKFKPKLVSIIEKPIIHDCCILFSYHKNDSVTHRHFELIKKLNPHYPVVPVAHTCSAIDGTFNLKEFQSPWDESNEWRACDIIPMKWFLNRTHTAKRYALIEFDVYTEISVNDYFSDVWDSEIGCPGYIDKSTRKHRWQWFDEIDNLPEQYKQFAAGIVPLATTMLSHDAFIAVSEKAKSMNDIFCELRMGTCAKASGIIPKIISKSASVRHSFKLIKKQEYKTFYHPIKKDDDIDKLFSE